MTSNLRRLDGNLFENKKVSTEISQNFFMPCYSL